MPGAAARDMPLAPLARPVQTGNTEASAMSSRKISASWFFATAVVAAAGFVAVTRAVAQGKTARWDHRAKRAVHTARVGGAEQALTATAHATTPLGKWWGQVPAALLTAVQLRRKGRTTAAWAIASTSLVAAVLPGVLDRLTVQRLSPRERRGGQKQSYPSGHALRTSAMAISVGYVMHRERLAAPAWLTPLAPLSLATGLGRLILDRHWTSDLVGGYCAGIALGATSAGLYELGRGSA
jgi:membrane-associated phospholipid phosphatase